MFQQMLDEYDAVLKMHCEREKQCIPAASVCIHAEFVAVCCDDSSRCLYYKAVTAQAV